MAKITVDEALRSKLRNFAEPLELCDESGQVLALLTPAVAFQQKQPERRSKMLDLNQPVDVCDESGRVIGRTFAELDPSLYEGLEPQISAEELAKRMQHKGKTYTTAEVLAHLERL